MHLRRLAEHRAASADIAPSSEASESAPDLDPDPIVAPDVVPVVEEMSDDVAPSDEASESAPDLDPDPDDDQTHPAGAPPREFRLVAQIFEPIPADLARLMGSHLAPGAGCIEVLVPLEEDRR
jgi:hypothetical protein